MFAEGKSSPFAVLRNFIISMMALTISSVTILAMEPTDTILTSGFRLGRLFRATWRLNFLFPITALALMWRMQDVSLGLMAAGILLFSVILHELAHLVASRTLGGDMDEILVWPLGGLTHPYGRGYLSDHARVLFAGPMLNLVIALSCMTRLSNQQVAEIVQGFTIQTTSDAPGLVVVVQLMFATNMLLFLVNLLPIVPFDSGILLRTYLTDRFSEVESRDLMIRSGLVMGVFGLLLGFVFDQATVVAVSAILVVMHTHENMRWLEMLTDVQEPDVTDDADVNSGSVAEEQLDFGPPLMPMSELPPPEPDHSLIEDQNSLLHEEVLDEILEKLHTEGRDSLSELEVTLLEQLSDRIRRQRRSSL